MTHVEETFILKPKKSFREQYLSPLFVTQVFPDSTYLYVPERFVVGYFWQEKDGLEINNFRTFYTDSPKDMEEWKQRFHEGKFEIISIREVLKTQLDSLAQKMKEYVEKRDNMETELSDLLKIY